MNRTFPKLAFCPFAVPSMLKPEDPALNSFVACKGVEKDIMLSKRIVEQSLIICGEI